MMSWSCYDVGVSSSLSFYEDFCFDVSRKMMMDWDHLSSFFSVYGQIEKMKVRMM